MRPLTRIQVGILLLAGSLLAGFVAGEPADCRMARQVATRQLQRLDPAGTHRLGPAGELSDDPGGDRLAWIFALEPCGYIVVTADTELPPVIAYSLDTAAESGPAPVNPLLALLRADLHRRKESLPLLAEEQRQTRRQSWTAFLDSTLDPAARGGFQQWPPAGTTPTGGWLAENWTQNAPYNDLCPTDPVAGGRSLAGCPAVAMAAILHYLETTHDTAFDDADDYYHNYAGRQYWIDDAHAARGFPSWTELNGYLATLQSRYEAHEPPTDTDKAALVFACGAAARQVFTASGSGTFGVDQAHQAWLRFDFTGVSLLTANDSDLLPRLAQNMKDAHPAHLAVVTPAWDAGHNLVVDGYNTDQFFHCNFGWGGAYNGWYLLPDGLPYNLTVIEGVILDITPPAVPGDLNEDGCCDSLDCLILAHYLSGSIAQGEGGFTAPAIRGDLSGDGLVRVIDLVLMQLP
jgi:hypothetical protein